MDFSPFKQDLDELLKEFSEGELKTLADMKKLWLERKFSYVFEARPSTSLNIFMQSLYNHSISYMISTNSLSQRLGALYALYCLYETQPFKPPFKIYLSLGELRRLTALVVNAKENGIKVVSVLVKRMLEKNAFLFGFVNINDYSEKERIKELVDVQNACIKKMHEKLLANTEIERYLHMDMGMELDLEVLRKMANEYEGTKNLAIREASRVVDTENIKHIAEDRLTIGDEVQKINEEWGNQKEMFSQFIGTDQHSVITHHQREERHHKQPMLLSAAEQHQSEDELQHTGFMELLMGNESPLVNGNIQQAPSELHLMPDEEQDYDLEYAKDLEDQLFDDIL
ncbi:uncharacterized protein LOC110707989 [Chenopodium quinoa]|uniref:uncharacterized protein LOC110707989 n=1 Tax=Chenopodium quinoa TaxID=63459 RepID=UPI000B776B0B|nr:uncharacterized protein LOC110707989 [Chenopodium quinoa]